MTTALNCAAPADTEAPCGAPLQVKCNLSPDHDGPHWTVTLWDANGLRVRLGDLVDTDQWRQLDVWSHLWPNP